MCHFTKGQAVLQRNCFSSLSCWNGVVVDKQVLNETDFFCEKIYRIFLSESYIVMKYGTIFQTICVTYDFVIWYV